jgi:pyruvate/2-oxoglutarate dehydrogenase complex dihydrolipoamide dehydrogenase (E3) component
MRETVLHFDVIVVGGGPAGVTAAMRARELGASTALVERGRLGGTCTNDGCVPTRVLAKAARLLRDAEQFPEYGLQTVFPQLDFRKLMAHAQNTVYSIHEKKQLIDHLLASGADVFHEVGPARFVDPHTIQLPDGRHLSGEKFILCAGGRARRLDFPGADLAITHSDVWSLKELPPSLVVVGGAATGCQVASIFNAFGVQVTILERAPQLLGIEDHDVVDLIQKAFHGHGIKTIAGIDTVLRIERNADDLNLVYSKQGREKTIRASAVMLSAGWVGNLDSLNLEAAGIKTSGPYIRVDDNLRTNLDHVYAAGDINGRIMLVQTAGFEAHAAVEHALLGSRHSDRTDRIIPHGGFTDPEYGSVGLTEEAARREFDCVVSSVSYDDLDRAVIDGHPHGLCKLIVSRENHRILGAHVVGEQALEIVHIAAAAMAGDMWVEQLAELQIAYPTFTAVLGLAARQIVTELGVRPLAPEWRTLTRLHGAEWERAGSVNEV